ncbi:MAG: exostosin family protein [Variovorax sp.]|nr:exostosin family protein [Variovorax sp.]
MKLAILTAYPDWTWGGHAAGWLRDAARQDVHGAHTVVDDPDSADAILFMEGHPGDSFMERAVWHPLRRRHLEKTFLYHDDDYAFPLMPGIYPSLRAPYHKEGLTAGGVYLARIEENKAIARARELRLAQDLLYSFVGANNCAVRDSILRLSVPDTVATDTSGKHAWALDAGTRAAYEEDYARTCARSRFMLSPRGIGPSTYRLYEAMELGRCPVIIADDWVPPPFIPWEEFSIRIREDQVHELPRILADAPYEAMGLAARRAFENYIDKPHCFHYLAESVQMLMNAPQRDTRLLGRYAELMASDMRGYYIRSRLRAIRRRMRSAVVRQPKAA